MSRIGELDKEKSLKYLEIVSNLIYCSRCGNASEAEVNDNITIAIAPCMTCLVEERYRAIVVDGIHVKGETK